MRRWSAITSARMFSGRAARKDGSRPSGMLDSAWPLPPGVAWELPEEAGVVEPARDRLDVDTLDTAGVL